MGIKIIHNQKHDYWKETRHLTAKNRGRKVFVNLNQQKKTKNVKTV